MVAHGPVPWFRPERACMPEHGCILTVTQKLQVSALDTTPVIARGCGTCMHANYAMASSMLSKAAAASSLPVAGKQLTT